MNTPAQATPAIRPHVEIVNGAVKTNSLKVAEDFGKRHDDVLKRYHALTCSPEFTARNFAASDYIDPTGRTLPMIEMTRDGFTFLAMGFTGKRAAQWKEAYIEAFNRMEAELTRMNGANPPNPPPSPRPRTRVLVHFEGGEITHAWAVPPDAYVIKAEHMPEALKAHGLSVLPTAVVEAIRRTAGLLANAEGMA